METNNTPLDFFSLKAAYAKTQDAIRALSYEQEELYAALSAKADDLFTAMMKARAL